MSQDAVSCTSTLALITLKDKSHGHLQAQVDTKVCSQDKVNNFQIQQITAKEVNSSKS